MGPHECFQLGYLLWCADHGLTPEQTHVHVKAALEKRAFIGHMLGELVEAPARIISSVASNALPAAAILGIGVPAGVGLTGGYLAAKAVENNTDVDEAKVDEELAEYQRLTEHAQRQLALKRLRGLPAVGGRP